MSRIRPIPADYPVARRAADLAALLVFALLVTGCQDDEPDVPPRYATVASADGVEIAYAVAGNGPDVVLVHCWCGNRTFYDDVAADLARDHRVITLDLAGHGQSGDGRTDYTMEAFAGDVLAVMDQETIDDAVVVGHSMGGTVAMALAQLAPDRVHAVVGIDNLHRVAHGYTRAQLDAFMVPMRDDFASSIGGMVASMFPAGTDPAVIARAADTMTAAPPAVGLSAFENLFAFDLPAAARAYARPLYLVNDSAQPVDADQWREHGVEVQATLLDDVGHFPMFTAPDLFRSSLREAVVNARQG